MNKFFLYLSLSSFVLVTACETTPKDSSKAPDSSKTNAAKDTTTKVVEAPALTGKAGLVAKSWKALEVETPSSKLTGDLIDVRFNFKKDNTFEYLENGQKDSGKWKVNEEGTVLTLEYGANRIFNYEISSLTDDKMTITGKADGMQRTFVLGIAK